MLLGFMQWRWTPTSRSLTLPTNDSQYVNGWLRINWTQAIGMIFPIVLTVATVLFLNRSKVGTAMRALADNRDNTALLGVPVRRVEARRGSARACSSGSPVCCSPRLVSMEIVALTFSHPDRGAGGGADRAHGLVVGHAHRGVRDRLRAVRA